MEEYALEQTYLAEMQRREMAKQMEQLADLRNGMEVEDEGEIQLEDDLDPLERLEAEFRRQIDEK